MTTKGNVRAPQSGRSKKEDGATLKNLKAHAIVNFPVITWTVEQTYANPSKDFVELVYTFPTSYGSILQNISVELNERHLIGVVVAAMDADDAYSDAIADGDSAILIEKNDFGLFTMNIGNLGPGETCLIRYESATLLEVVDSQAKIIFPTVIDTRYGDPFKQGGLGIHGKFKKSWLVEYPLELSLSLSGLGKHFDVSSSTHRIKVSSSEGLIVRLDEVSYLDRDFELTLGNIPLEQSGFLCRDPFSDSEQYVSLSCFTWGQEDTQEDHSRSKTLKILVDCSGSMTGERIQQAKKALHSILSTFNPSQKFTLSKFGDDIEHFYSRPVKASSAIMKSAFEWIEAIDSNMGGTEMIQAIEEISRLGEDSASDVLLITDGEIWNGRQFIDTLIQNHLRLFVVAIGASSNNNMLISAAKATGGHAEVPHSDRHIEAAVLRLHKRILWPSAMPFSFTVNDMPTTWHQSTLSIFKNQSIPIFSIHSGHGQKSELSIRFKDGECVNELGLKSTLNEVQEQSICETLTRLCVARVIQEIEDRHGSSLNYEKMVAASENTWITEIDLRDLAIHYQLLSAETKYLLTDQRAVKAHGLPKFVSVTQMETTAQLDSIQNLNGVIGSVLRKSPGKDRTLQPIPVMFRMDNSRPSDKSDKPTYEIGKYPASRIEVIQAKLIFEAHLREAFDDFLAWHTEEILMVPEFLLRSTEQYAVALGIPSNLIAWAKSFGTDEKTLHRAISSIFTLINIKISGQDVSHTQFPPGSTERKLAQTLGYIA